MTAEELKAIVDVLRAGGVRVFERTSAGEQVHIELGPYAPDEAVDEDEQEQMRARRLRTGR